MEYAQLLHLCLDCYYCKLPYHLQLLFMASVKKWRVGMDKPIMDIIVVKYIGDNGKEYCKAITREEYQKEQLQEVLRAGSWKYRKQHLSQFE